MPACTPIAHWIIYSQEAQGLTATKLQRKGKVLEHFTIKKKNRHTGNSLHNRQKKVKPYADLLTVRALEVEEVKAWETAVTTLDKLFSNVTSATALDKLKPLYVLVGRKKQGCYFVMSFEIEQHVLKKGSHFLLSFKAVLSTRKTSFGA